jgi:hypothetical protein
MGKSEQAANASFGEKCANVVVGNPPWGDPKPKTQREREAIAGLKEWCDPDKGRPLGHNERSQAFIHLASSLLKEGGRAGLLVSSGVFFKHHDNSEAFRKIWLNSVQLRMVVNFAHVRRVFFSGPNRKAKAISPFASVVFEKKPLSLTPDSEFEYWSAKRTAIVEKVQAVVMTRGDMHRVRQRDCLEFEKLWKIYWWGSRSDEALVRTLDRDPGLLNLHNHFSSICVTPGRGFLEGDKSITAKWLSDFKELPVEHLNSYGRQPLTGLIKVPAKVERRGQREVFEGSRLLLRRGIPSGGKLTVRHETRPFCFRHSVLGFRFEGFEQWQERIITGIYWSQLARYYFFTTVGSWGMWHDELQVETAGALPIRFPPQGDVRARIIRCVEDLQALDFAPGGLELADHAAHQRVPVLEQELDDAVFELYGLNDAERDLVTEMCRTGFDLFYGGSKSEAVQSVAPPHKDQGSCADVVTAGNDLSGYLEVFISWWNEELSPDSELAWRIVSPPSGAPLLAIIFEIRFHQSVGVPFASDEQSAWKEVLETLAQHAHVPAGSSKIFTDTFFRVTTADRQILIVKRNERRFWTKTAAREDAEATSLQAMRLQTELATA